MKRSLTSCVAILTICAAFANHAHAQSKPAASDLNVVLVKPSLTTDFKNALTVKLAYHLEGAPTSFAHDVVMTIYGPDGSPLKSRTGQPIQVVVRNTARFPSSDLAVTMVLPMSELTDALGQGITEFRAVFNVYDPATQSWLAPMSHIANIKM